MLKTFVKTLLFFVILFVSVIFINTLRLRSQQIATVTTIPAPPISPAALKHFQQLIRFKTISWNDHTLFDSIPFLQLHQYLQQAYPLVHQRLQREVVSKYTLLYHWKGADTTAPPLLLMAHMDVVPVEEVNIADWKADPFAGAIKDSCIWGRGAWDNKINLVSMLEATEKLLQQGVQPKRSIYFLFSHDEELTGKQGTSAAAALFRQRGIHPGLVIDEGGIVTSERIPGVNKPVALLGTAEKGYLNLQLEVQKNGGHSSMPEKETAIDILTTALGKLRQHPFEGRLAPAQQDFIRYLGPELPFFKRMAFANTGLFESLIIKQYEKTPTGNALMHTTMTPTILRAGIKENIIPSAATAILNLRLLTGDSCKQVTAQIQAIIDDPRVKVTTLDHMEPSASTPVNSIAFQQVEAAVKKTFPHTIVTPFLVVGATDSHHFGDLATHIIRFTPAIDPQNFHGVNERVSLKSFQMALWFYEQLLKEVGSKK
jgi:carboxypeptidase PM20D1